MVRQSALELMKVLMKYTLCLLCNGESFDQARDHIWSVMERLALDMNPRTPLACPYAFGSSLPRDSMSFCNNFPSDNETSRMLSSFYIWLDDLLQNEIASGRDMTPLKTAVDSLRHVMWIKTWNVVSCSLDMAWILD